jgi:membrane protein implicated in regulation of membrane protease activity
MLSHKAFGGFLMGLGIVIVATYVIIMLINSSWAIILAVTVLVSLVGMMFFWLGFKVITSSQMPKEGAEESEKV